MKIYERWFLQQEAAGHVQLFGWPLVFRFEAGEMSLYSLNFSHENCIFDLLFLFVILTLVAILIEWVIGNTVPFKNSSRAQSEAANSVQIVPPLDTLITSPPIIPPKTAPSPEAPGKDASKP